MSSINKDLQHIRSLPGVVDPLFDSMMSTCSSETRNKTLFPSPPRVTPGTQVKMPDLIFMHDRYYMSVNDKYVRKNAINYKKYFNQVKK